MHDRGLPIATRLGCRPGAIREIRKCILFPKEYCAGLGSSRAVAAVTGNATTLVDLLPILRVRRLGVVEHLCGKKRRATKKYYQERDEYARRFREKPCGAEHSRFVDGIQRQTSFVVAKPHLHS